MRSIFQEYKFMAKKQRPLIRFLTNDARKILAQRTLGNSNFEVSEDGTSFLDDGCPVSDIKVLRPLIERAVLSGQDIGGFLSITFGPEIEKQISVTEPPATAESGPSTSELIRGLLERSPDL